MSFLLFAISRQVIAWGQEGCVKVAQMWLRMMILREELEVTKRLMTKAVVSDQDDFLREIAGDIAGSASY